MVHLNGWNDGEGPLICPALICDTCGKQVTGSGNIYWAFQYDTGRIVRQTTFYALHKGSCQRRWDQWTATVYPSADGWTTSYWSEARDFVAQLASNFANPLVPRADGSLVIHDPAPLRVPT